MSLSDFTLSVIFISVKNGEQKQNEKNEKQNSARKANFQGSGIDYGSRRQCRKQEGRAP
jgi:hypothetical protein